MADPILTSNLYLGNPCKYGHSGLRYVRDRHCFDCKRLRKRSKSKITEQDKVSTNDPHLRNAIYHAFDGKCFYTGRHVSFDEFHIDHITPPSKGGTDCIANYVVSCEYINSKKRNHHSAQFAKVVTEIVALIFVKKVIRFLNESLKGKRPRLPQRRKKKQNRTSHIFEITKDDIINWTARRAKDSAMDCPIAEAISRNMPNANRVTADMVVIRWNDLTTRKRYTYMTPNKVSQFIMDFRDIRKSLRPFTIRLYTPIAITDLRHLKR